MSKTSSTKDSWKREVVNLIWWCMIRFNFTKWYCEVDNWIWGREG